MTSHIPVLQSGKREIPVAVASGRLKQYEKQDGQQLRSRKKLEPVKGSQTQKPAYKTKAQQLSEYKEQLEKLQNQLQEKEVKLNEVKRNAGEREDNLMSDIQELQTKVKQLDDKLESYEQRLLLSSIDPVSLESLKNTEEEDQNLNFKRQIAKQNVQKLKTMIDELNAQSEERITKLKSIGNELDCIGIESSAVV